MTEIVSPQQIQGLKKIGNLIIPGDETFPSFAQIFNHANLTYVLEQMPSDDLKDLKLLLNFFYYCPIVGLKLLLFIIEQAATFSPGFTRYWPGINIFRLIRVGLRGICFTLYYGDEKITHLMGYSVAVYTQDLTD